MPSNKGKKTHRSQFGSVRKLPSGRFQATYKRTADGKTTTIYNPNSFATKTEAQNWLALERHLIITGKWTQPGTPDPINTETPTFAQFAKRHIQLQTNSKGQHLRASTVAKYETYLSKYLQKFAPLPITLITKAMVDEWWAKAISGGKITTASKAYKFLHSVFARAVADGWLKGNASPCQVKGAQNASSGKSGYTPSLQEVQEVASKIKPEFRVLTLLSAFAALRFGEATALQRKHLELRQVDGSDRYLVNIERAVVYVNGKFILDNPKNLKGKAGVLISSSMTELITEYLESMENKDPEALVFPNPKGGYLRNDIFAKALKAAVLKAGHKGKAITPHSLRRAGGTAYSNLGANLDEVKKYLRDSTTAAALRYVQATGRTASLAEGMKLSDM